MKRKVLIVGGGVAALEALLALSHLANDQVELTILAPGDDFIYRPLAVTEPFFGMGHLQRYPLARFARDTGARHVRGSLAEVMPDKRSVRCKDGSEIGYDELVLATGIKPVPAFEHAVTFVEDTAHDALAGILADLEEGYSRSVAFVAPPIAWTLPIYELALMMSAQVRGMGIDNVQLTVVSPEDRPLEPFGRNVSSKISEILTEAQIEFIGRGEPVIEPGEIHLRQQARTVKATRIIALPHYCPHFIPGVQTDSDGYIEVDDNGATKVSSVYAAGDATAYPVKQGGIATQQADAVAEAIAVAASASIEQHPFSPVLRGILFTGTTKYFLRRHLGDQVSGGEIDSEPLWWPPNKVVGRYLTPYLSNVAQSGFGSGHHLVGSDELAPPEGAVDGKVEVFTAPQR